MKRESKAPSARSTMRPPARTSRPPPEKGPKRRETVEVDLEWVELTDAVNAVKNGKGLRPPPIPGAGIVVPPLPINGLAEEASETPLDEETGRAPGPKRRQTMEVQMDWVELVASAATKRAKVTPIPREEDDAPPVARRSKKKKS